MKYKDRISKDTELPDETGKVTISQMAEEVFGDLAECFVVVGYAKGSGEKFACRIANDEICEEALEPLREAVCQWFNLGLPHQEN